MITFPLPGGRNLFVIEPGNIARLKEGRGLKLGEGSMICFTPDMKAFLESIGVPSLLEVKEGQRIEHQIDLSAEQLTAALTKCLKNPEVER